MLDEWTATQNDVLDDGFSPPAPYVIEDELIRTFNHLEIQALLHTDTALPDVHVRLNNFGATGIAKMPKEFQTFKEALKYGKAIIRRCAHFMSMSWMYDDDNLVPPDTSFSIMDRVSSCTNPEAFCEQDKYAKELIRWHSAFLPLLHRARTSAGKADFNTATCVQMHYQVTFIGVGSALATNELLYDSLTPCSLKLSILQEQSSEAVRTRTSHVLSAAFFHLTWSPRNVGILRSDVKRSNYFCRGHGERSSGIP